MDNDWFANNQDFSATSQLKTANKWQPMPTLPIRIKNNPHCWMYNNIPASFRSSWLDTFSWTIGKLDDTCETTDIQDAIYQLDTVLLDLAKGGSLGFAYTTQVGTRLVAARCKYLNIPYIEYYLPLDVFDKHQIPDDVEILSTVTSEQFTDYIKKWSEVTLAWNINGTYISYIADQHNGPFLTPSIPELINNKATETYFTGPPYWLLTLDENSWSSARWGASIGQDIINPFMWSSKIIRSWLTLPGVVDLVTNYKREGIPILSTDTIYNTILIKPIKGYRRWNSPAAKASISNWRTVAKRHIDTLYQEHHNAPCSWPLHRLADKLGMIRYKPLDEDIIKIYGEVNGL